MKEEIFKLLDLLLLFDKSPRYFYGNYHFYFGYNDTNCYAGITKNKPPRRHKNDLYALVQNNLD